MSSVKSNKVIDPRKWQKPIWILFLLVSIPFAWNAVSKKGLAQASLSQNPEFPPPCSDAYDVMMSIGRLEETTLVMHKDCRSGELKWTADSCNLNVDPNGDMAVGVSKNGRILRQFPSFKDLVESYKLGKGEFISLWGYEGTARLWLTKRGRQKTEEEDS